MLTNTQSIIPNDLAQITKANVRIMQPVIIRLPATPAIPSLLRNRPLVQIMRPHHKPKIDRKL